MRSMIAYEYIFDKNRHEIDDEFNFMPVNDSDGGLTRLNNNHE